MNEEELEKFLEEHKDLKLWCDGDIPEWTEKANNIGKGGGYSLDYDKNGIIVESKVVDSGTLEIRSSIKVDDQHHFDVYEFLLDNEYSYKYDEMIHSFKILETINEDQTLNFYEAKSPLPWLISRRDFVYSSFHKQLEDGSYIILLKSVEGYHEYPPVNGVVRGWINYTIFHVMSDPENEKNSLVLYLTNVDGRGMVPKIVTNFIARKKFPSQINKMKLYMKLYPEYRDEKKKKKKKEEEEEETEGENDEEEKEEEKEEKEVKEKRSLGERTQNINLQLLDPPTFPYASEEELEDGEKYYTEEIIAYKHLKTDPENGFSKKSVMIDMIKQFKTTPHFFRISIPIIFISPISMLEQISAYYSPTPSILGISKCKSPEERMLRVVKWALRNIPRKIHRGICHIKPFNPILGEQLIWKWKHNSHNNNSESFGLGEQVSHHPPISSFYISNRKKNFSLRTTIFPISKLFPNSFELSFAGEVNLKIHNLEDEEYMVEVPPLVFHGILFGEQYSEHNGVYRIVCKKTKYAFLMLFKEKDQNKVVGRIIRNNDEEDEEETLYKLNGKANGKILIKNMRTNKVSVFCDNNSSSSNKFYESTKAYMRPLIAQKPNESRRNWHMPTKMMKEGKMEEAVKYKEAIENIQRLKKKKKKEEKEEEEWKPNFFRVLGRESVRVKKFNEEEIEVDVLEEVKTYECILENRTPYEEGEKDPFENHPMFQF